MDGHARRLQHGGRGRRARGAAAAGRAAPASKGFALDERSEAAASTGAPSRDDTPHRLCAADRGLAPAAGAGLACAPQLADEFSAVRAPDAADEPPTEEPFSAVPGESVDGAVHSSEMRACGGREGG